MVCGKVVAASVDEDCIDAKRYIIWDKLKPAHYCGNAYKNGLVASHQPMWVDMVYKSQYRSGRSLDEQTRIRFSRAKAQRTQSSEKKLFLCALCAFARGISEPGLKVQI
ncbi:MAG: hypothetical protein FJ145_22485 [Deltaproteobacteria bacterium]|nr:hypothetical protein [Deltaproteobacteria bacterium]